MAAATLTQILDDLNDYADYEEVGSVARARSYVTAARRFLQLPSGSAEQGTSANYSPEMIENEIALARAFISANAQNSAQSSSVRFLTTREGFMR
jgi:hypothetical protein